jgi:hypothetical protein
LWRASDGYLDVLAGPPYQGEYSNVSR